MLTDRARNQIRIALRSTEAANVFADVIESGGGVLNHEVRRQLATATHSRPIADRICDSFEQGQPIEGREFRTFAIAIGSFPVATQINNALATISA